MVGVLRLKHSSGVHEYINMDILMKHAAVIIGTIDGAEALTTLKDNGYLNWSSYLTLRDYEDSEMQTLKLVDMLVVQENHKAIAKLFEIIRISYPDLCSMIPEISYGQRYSVYIGHNDFLKVMVNDGNVTVDIMKMEASTYAFQYV